MDHLSFPCHKGKVNFYFFKIKMVMMSMKHAGYECLNNENYYLFSQQHLVTAA